MEEQLQTPQTEVQAIEDESLEYLWITNEGLLRDEGVIFGMEGADASAKMDAIRSYHERDKAPNRKEMESLRLRIEETTAELAANQNRTGALTSERNGLPARQNSPVDLGLLFQLLAYLGICLLNYALLRFWSYRVFGSDLIIAGVYLLGLFSVFSGRGSIYRINGSQEEGEGRPGREMWKVYAEEYLIPLCTSVFVVVMSWQLFEPHQSIAFFFVLTVLFVFSGKAFVFILFLFREWQSGFFTAWRERRRQGSMKKYMDVELNAMSLEREGLEKRHTEYRQKLDEAEGRYSALNALEEYRIKLFMSEYDVALTAYGKKK